jgi:predicted hotdog family 3-hydroxylacyl-ACP dehydratase
MSITKEELARLLPHGESMRLLDLVEIWDEQNIRCRTSTHRHQQNPLRSRGRLTVSAGLLYHGHRTQAPIGYVGSVRDVTFSVSRLDDLEDDLTIDASRMVEGADSYMYRFTVSHRGSAVIEGRASIFIQPAV